MSRKTRAIAKAALDLVNGYREMDALMEALNEHPGKTHFEAAKKKVLDSLRTDCTWATVSYSHVLKEVPEVHKYKVHEYTKLLDRRERKLDDLNAAEGVLYRYS